MSNKIGWCDDTWVPYTGCSKVSPGCENCYALTMSNRLAHMPKTKEFYEPSIKKTTGGKVNWTGAMTLNLPQFGKPFTVKKPTIFFVSSMSDIFHEDLTFEMIDDIFDVMYQCHYHTFKVLTKRAKKMFDYFEWKVAGKGYAFKHWPPHNIHLGVSAENQKYLDERMPYLLRCPASVRFLSCEPLLGPIDIPFAGTLPKDWGIGYTAVYMRLHQVIVGGESGPSPRTMQPEWAISLRDQCKEFNIAFWFKQWGGKEKSKLLDGVEYQQHPFNA